MQQPKPGEYLPYYQKYIDMQPAEVPYAALLTTNTDEVLRLFGRIPEERHKYRYAPGKWTIKDVLMHVIDTERAMSFRALVAARGDSNMQLFTLDEDRYAENVDTTARSMDSLLEEFAAVRKATALLLNNVPEPQTLWACNVAGNRVTVRALAYIITGHVAHHLAVIRERYL